MEEKDNVSEEVKDEIDLLLSEKEVKVNNKKVIIHKISLLDSIRLTSKLSNIASKILEDSDATASALTKITFKGAKDDDTNINAIHVVGITELLAIIGEDSASLLEDVIGKTTNMSDDDIDNISAEDGIDILFDIYEVNKGFFTKFMNKLQKKTKKHHVKKTK